MKILVLAGLCFLFVAPLLSGCHAIHFNEAIESNDLQISRAYLAKYAAGVDRPEEKYQQVARHLDDLLFNIATKSKNPDVLRVYLYEKYIPRRHKVRAVELFDQWLYKKAWKLDTPSAYLSYLREQDIPHRFLITAQTRHDEAAYQEAFKAKGFEALYTFRTKSCLLCKQRVEAQREECQRRLNQTKISIADTLEACHDVDDSAMLLVLRYLHTQVPSEPKPPLRFGRRRPLSDWKLVLLKNKEVHQAFERWLKEEGVSLFADFLKALEALPTPEAIGQSIELYRSFNPMAQWSPKQQIEGLKTLFSFVDQIGVRQMRACADFPDKFLSEEQRSKVQEMAYESYAAGDYEDDLPSLVKENGYDSCIDSFSAIPGLHRHWSERHYGAPTSYLVSNSEFLIDQFKEMLPPDYIEFTRRTGSWTVFEFDGHDTWCQCFPNAADPNELKDILTFDERYPGSEYSGKLLNALNEDIQSELKVGGWIGPLCGDPPDCEALRSSDSLSYENYRGYSSYEEFVDLSIWCFTTLLKHLKVLARHPKLAPSHAAINKYLKEGRKQLRAFKKEYKRCSRR